jgi:L-ascorbate metabolism protein UlaG (beta-lactamase superfamily)
MGHAAFLLETGSGTKIITDPYEPGSYNGAVGYAPIGVEADIVTISHQHPDHAYAKGFARARIIDSAGNFSVKDITIEGINSYHDDQKGAARGKNIIFVITAEDLKVVHLGDLGTTDIDAERIKMSDVVLIPVGGTFTLDAGQADQLIQGIAPGIVIPMHFKTEKLAFPIEGVEKFLQGKDYETRDFLEINPRNKGDYKKIIVLTPQR